jgi:lipoprotein-releasing system permease protein
MRLSGKGGGTATSIVIAIAGISLAIVIMMAALCIVTGFKHEIRRKVMGFDAHVSIISATNNVEYADELETDNNGSPVLTFSPQLVEIINDTHLFSHAELVMEHPVVLKTDNDFEGLVLRGMTPGPGVDFIASTVIDGTWRTDSVADDYDDNTIAISRMTADKLGIATGDRVFAYFFTNEGVRARRLTIKAIYDTHFSDYDKIYAFAPISLLQGVNDLNELQGNRIDLYLHDTSDIDGSALTLQNAMMKAAWAGNLDGLYRISSVTSTAMMYFNWLELLDTNVVVVLVLMALLSAFTLISSIIIIILERVRMIGILKALGASNASISHIFSLLGRRLVIYGMIIGNGLGLMLMFLQQHFHLLPLDPEAYYLDFVPVEINVAQIILLNICVFVISWAVLLIPGILIATVSPATSIRFE